LWVLFTPVISGLLRQFEIYGKMDRLQHKVSENAFVLMACFRLDNVKLDFNINLYYFIFILLQIRDFRSMYLEKKKIILVYYTRGYCYRWLFSSFFIREKYGRYADIQTMFDAWSWFTIWLRSIYIDIYIRFLIKSKDENKDLRIKEQIYVRSWMCIIYKWRKFSTKKNNIHQKQLTYPLQTWRSWRREAVHILLGDGKEPVYGDYILFSAIVQCSGRIKPVRWRICIPGDCSCWGLNEKRPFLLPK